eukprot:TRINITY_DN969_c0_g1_i4.p1 TRINITY_DN969_c0_g1~~TRINITY_DN969_c0_g1_i4.p1  ORF type:complete len:230 (-),score=41.76 TRINITY_DN969_c0_g1_i4:1377-2066(-)
MDYNDFDWQSESSMSGYYSEVSDEDDHNRITYRNHYNDIDLSLPNGWFRAGTHPKNYVMGLDCEVWKSPETSAFIKSKRGKDVMGQFGTIMQQFFPKSYLGKRLQLSGSIRYECEQNSWAAMWMRVDGPLDPATGEKNTLSDTMSDRQLTGNSRGLFEEYYIVLDIPKNAVNVAFGFMLHGKGIVWADDFKFEVVPLSVPLTGGNVRTKRFRSIISGSSESYSYSRDQD